MAAPGRSGQLAEVDSPGLPTVSEGFVRLQAFLRIAPAAPGSPGETALDDRAQQAVGSMQAHGYVRPREVQSACDIGGRALLEVAEPHDVAKGRRQLVDHLKQHARQFAEVQGRLGGRGVGEREDPRLGVGGSGVDRGRRELAPFGDEAMHRLVTYDGRHPGACGRTALVLPELLQHDDPALLERVVGRCVIARDAPGKRQETGRAAPDPRFGVVVE